jgi:hypothetical protein
MFIMDNGWGVRFLAWIVWDGCTISTTLDQCIPQAEDCDLERERDGYGHIEEI